MGKKLLKVNHTILQNLIGTSDMDIFEVQDRIEALQDLFEFNLADLDPQFIHNQKHKILYDLNSKARYLINIGMFTEASHTLNKLEEMCLSNKFWNELVRVYNNFCQYYRRIGDYPHGALYISKAKKTGYKYNALKNIGETYQNQSAFDIEYSNFDDALTNSEKTVTIMYKDLLEEDDLYYSFLSKDENIERKNEVTKSLGIANGNLGLAYKAKKDYKKARQTFEKAVKLLRSIGGVQPVVLEKIEREIRRQTPITDKDDFEQNLIKKYSHYRGLDGKIDIENKKTKQKLLDANKSPYNWPVSKQGQKLARQELLATHFSPKVTDSLNNGNTKTKTVVINALDDEEDEYLQTRSSDEGTSPTNPFPYNWDVKPKDNIDKLREKILKPIRDKEKEKKRLKNDLKDKKSDDVIEEAKKQVIIKRRRDFEDLLDEELLEKQDVHKHQRATCGIKIEAPWENKCLGKFSQDGIEYKTVDAEHKLKGKTDGDLGDIDINKLDIGEDEAYLLDECDYEDIRKSFYNNNDEIDNQFMETENQENLIWISDNKPKKANNQKPKQQEIHDGKIIFRLNKNRLVSSVF